MPFAMFLLPLYRTERVYMFRGMPFATGNKASARVKKAQGLIARQQGAVPRRDPKRDVRNSEELVLLPAYLYRFAGSTWE